jgi:hypothetical protein
MSRSSCHDSMNLVSCPSDCLGCIIYAAAAIRETLHMWFGIAVIDIVVVVVTPLFISIFVQPEWINTQPKTIPTGLSPSFATQNRRQVVHGQGER